MASSNPHDILLRSTDVNQQSWTLPASGIDSLAPLQGLMRIYAVCRWTDKLLLYSWFSTKQLRLRFSLKTQTLLFQRQNVSHTNVHRSTTWKQNLHSSERPTLTVRLLRKVLQQLWAAYPTTRFYRVLDTQLTSTFALNTRYAPINETEIKTAKTVGSQFNIQSEKVFSTNYVLHWHKLVRLFLSAAHARLNLSTTMRTVDQERSLFHNMQEKQKKIQTFWGTSIHCNY